MIEHYLDAISVAPAHLLEVFTNLALPLALVLGITLLVSVVAARMRKGDAGENWRAQAPLSFGYAAVAVVVVVAWAALGTAQTVAHIDQNWRESVESTTNSVPDAPPVTQTGPALASLETRTYTRTLRLPSSFLRRIGTEGADALAPYLTDPSAENILRLKDTFRRSGRDVVFTRQATQVDEAPMPFADSRVSLRFERLTKRAYDALFEGRYLIRNATAKPITAQFLFNLPQAGTVRDLKVTIGAKAVTDPNDEGAYRWTDKLGAGETREALVQYRVVGARAWQYDLGSSRRRVQNFQLDAATSGDVRFGRGSLQPTTIAGRALNWKLENVVTAQKIALVFPADTWAQKGYLQALGALPISFILFLIGALALGGIIGRVPLPARLGMALGLFALGLGASTVLAVYLPVLWALLLAPLVGAMLASAVLGRRFALAALPAALVPATFLSEHHSGLMLLALALVTFAVALSLRSKRAANVPADAAAI